MRPIIKAVAVAAVLTAPAISFAQYAQQTEPPSRPLTRAEVKADLQRVEQAGYQPQANDAYYPTNMQAAEARAAQTSGYGPATSGSSQSGGPNRTGAASSYSPPVEQQH